MKPPRKGATKMAVQPAAPEPKQLPFSFLQGLTLTTPPKRAGKQGDALAVARSRVISGLQQQKERVQLVMDGKPLPKMEGGKKTVAAWFYKEADGAYSTRLRYGQSAIPLVDGKTAVRVGKLDQLPAFYDLVIASIERGELDAQLTQMQKEKSDSLTK